MGFNTGYCALAFNLSDKIQYVHGSAVSAWEPINVPNLGVLIPVADAAASVVAGYYFKGIFKFAIANGVTVTKDDILWYDSTNNVVQNTAPTAGYLIGKAVVGGVGTSTGSVLASVLINVAPTVKAAGLFTTAGGDTTETIPAVGAAVGDVVLVTVNTVGSSPVLVVAAIAAANAITVTMSDDPSTDHVLNYIVIGI